MSYRISRYKNKYIPVDHGKSFINMKKFIIYF